jgi:hypothetical protein
MRIVSPPPVPDAALIAQLERATTISLRDHPDRQPWKRAGGGIGRSMRGGNGRHDSYTLEYDSTPAHLRPPTQAPGRPDLVLLAHRTLVQPVLEQALERPPASVPPDPGAVLDLLRAHGCATRTQLAAFFRVSFLLLDRTLTRLRADGVITSKRGPAGGVCLAENRWP